MRANLDAAAPSLDPRGFARLELIRLVLSYQRYALLLLSLGVAALGASWLSDSWVMAVGAGLLAAPLLWFGALVGARLPHKLRLTATQDARIRRGRFDPRDLQAWTEDPCYRVVAREIVRRAGRSPAEARRIVNDLAREADNAPRVFYRRPDPGLDGPTPPRSPPPR